MTEIRTQTHEDPFLKPVAALPLADPLNELLCVLTKQKEVSPGVASLMSSKWVAYSFLCSSTERNSSTPAPKSERNRDFDWQSKGVIASR